MRGTTVTFTALFGQQDGCFHDFAEYHDYSQPCVKLVVNMAELSSRMCCKQAFCFLESIINVTVVPHLLDMLPNPFSQHFLM